MTTYTSADLDAIADSARQLADLVRAARHDAESVFNPTFDEQVDDLVWGRRTR